MREDCNDNRNSGCTWLYDGVLLGNGQGDSRKRDPGEFGAGFEMRPNRRFCALHLWAVRAVANRIGMPPCSENDALDHFDQAIGSSGHDKELHLYRYKILTKLGRSEEAKAAVESGRSIPITFRSEQPVQDELEKIWTQNYS